jgi:hypothetical protein
MPRTSGSKGARSAGADALGTGFAGPRSGAAGAARASSAAPRYPTCPSGRGEITAEVRKMAQQMVDEVRAELADEPSRP